MKTLAIISCLLSVLLSCHAQKEKTTLKELLSDTSIFVHDSTIIYPDGLVIIGDVTFLVDTNNWAYWNEHKEPHSVKLHGKLNGKWVTITWTVDTLILEYDTIH